jgi:hypothetical protein
MHFMDQQATPQQPNNSPDADGVGEKALSHDEVVKMARTRSRLIDLPTTGTQSVWMGSADFKLIPPKLP